jgi:predicted lipoprotein with Yx(FWY)xxD motif
MSTTRTRAAAWTIALVAIPLALVSGASAAGKLVMTAHNVKLHATILVNRSGHTLYNLSVERNGRFICKNSACLSVWHPLVVAKGAKPLGAVPLGTVKRPDGRFQVTYKGAPLYTFAQDLKRGDTKGEGFKDVGVWHATTVGAKATTSSKPPGGGYSY